MAERVAIVTGAGKGIAAACARELAARGYGVVLMSPSGSARALAAELGGHGMDGSVLEQRDVDALVRLALDTYGRIDAVVSSTGHASWSTAPTGPLYDPHAESHLLDIPDQDWHGMLDLLFLSVVRVARAVTPQLERQGGGAIVNISGIGARVPFLAYPSGATMRLALSGFTKLYTDRYGPRGIRMNNVLPGFMDNIAWDAPILRNVPLGRAGQLGEIAKTVAFLLSEDAGYITGQSILADGGVSRDFA